LSNKREEITINDVPVRLLLSVFGFSDLGRTWKHLQKAAFYEKKILE